MDHSDRARDIQTIVETIWLTMLGIPIDRLPETADQAMNGDCLAHITINGNWEGSLELSCSMGLARFVGAALFQEDPWELDEESSLEAVLELTNMIGGNVKALVGEGNRLGLPELQPSESGEGEQEASLLFDCLGEPLALQLIRRDE